MGRARPRESASDLVVVAQPSTSDAGEGENGPVDQRSEQRALEEAVTRLSERFPTVDRESIARIAAEEYKSLSGAKVRDYIPVLVENAATDRLRLLGKLQQPRDFVSSVTVEAAASLAEGVDDEVRADPFEVEAAKERSGLLGDLRS